MDGYLRSVPMFAAKAYNVGVVAPDGNGARGDGGVEAAMLKQELDCKGGAVGFGMLCLKGGGERDVTSGDDGAEPVGAGRPPENGGSAAVTGVGLPASCPVEGEFVPSVAGLTVDGVREGGIDCQEGVGLHNFGGD